MLRLKARVGVGGIRGCCHPARAFLLCLLEIEGIIKRVKQFVEGRQEGRHDLIAGQRLK